MMKKKFLLLSIFLWSFVSASAAKADLIMGGYSKPSIKMELASNYPERTDIINSITAGEFTEIFFVKIFTGLMIVIICLSIAAFIVFRMRRKNVKEKEEINKNS